MPHRKKVLIVDASKVIRASVAKCLKGGFRVCEENNGEAAWQTLVLDSSIDAVVSAHHLAKLDGIGLVERMRENRLCRINRMPMVMLVSDAFTDDERAQAERCGVSGILRKDSVASDMRQMLNRLLKQALADCQGAEKTEAGDSLSTANGGPDFSGEITDVAGESLQLFRGLASTSGGQTEASASGSEPKLPPRCQVDEHLRHLLSGGAECKSLGVLVFGIDNYHDLIKRYSPSLAEKVQLKFSALLTRKIRSEDSIGALAPGRIAIVAPNIDRSLCCGFAKRVCKALATAKISIGGRRVDITVSAGIAMRPEDPGADTGEQLLSLANQRLDAAIQGGGDRVICELDTTLQRAKGDEFVARLKALIAATPSEMMTPCLGHLGLQIMPILDQLERSFHFGLPIEDMQRRLWDRARAERMLP